MDVREVAQAHVEAIKQEKAGGNRFAITTAPFTWQQALDAFHKDGKDLKKTFSKVPEGKPGSGDNTKQNSKFSTDQDAHWLTSRLISKSTTAQNRRKSSA